MDNRWTLHVEDFGKIKEAHITVAPLTLFVGENNSGKSYLMTLLYTLLRMRIEELDLCEELPEYRWCEEWLMSSIEEADSHEYLNIPFRGDILKSFEHLLNLILEQNKTAICQQAFGRGVTCNKITVTFPTDLVRYLCIERKREQFDMRAATEDSKWYFDFLSRRKVPFMDSGAVLSSRSEWPSLDGLRFIIAYILECLLKWGFSSAVPDHADVVFLPVSRTGFMLTYKLLTADSVSKVYGYSKKGKEISDIQLTKPYRDFLTAIPMIDSAITDDRNTEIVRFLEREIIHGAVTVSDGLPIPEFSYYPEGSELLFSMSLSSGVVTELSPLVLFLRHMAVRTLFIEEPEIGLHPELQRTMARVLIRLCNRGTPVFVTTHNNTTIQHINNMIRLYHLQEDEQQAVMDEFHFENEDLLNEEFISVYQFDVDKKSRVSTVRELTGDEYGFVVPTFKDALTNLLKQSHAARRKLQ